MGLRGAQVFLGRNLAEADLQVVRHGDGGFFVHACIDQASLESSTGDHPDTASRLKVSVAATERASGRKQGPAAGWGRLWRVALTFPEGLRYACARDAWFDPA